MSMEYEQELSQVYMSILAVVFLFLLSAALCTIEQASY